MTLPAPSVNENGWPLLYELSNSAPVVCSQPLYWTVTVSPLATGLPAPGVTMMYWRPADSVVGVPLTAGG